MAWYVITAVGMVSGDVTVLQTLLGFFSNAPPTSTPSYSGPLLHKDHCDGKGSCQMDSVHTQTCISVSGALTVILFSLARHRVQGVFYLLRSDS